MIANHLWQSTLFAVAVWVVTLALRKNRAAVRHRLWLVASLKFLVPFSLLANLGSQFQWATPVNAPPAVSRIAETISQPFSASSPSFINVSPGWTDSFVATSSAEPSRWPAVLVGIWSLGVAASFIWWFMRWRQVRRVVHRATLSNPDGPLRVMQSSDRLEPGVFGIFRPVLLLPEGIADRLSPAQLQSVLAHEFCHVQRRDNLTMAMHMFVEALFWFHPLVWWIKARLLDEQENACDEEVLRLGSEPMVYAESLLRVCEFYIESPLICVSGVTGSDLKKRVGRIMRKEIGETLNRWRKAALFTAGIAALAIPVVVRLVDASPIPPTKIAPIAPPAPTQVRPAALPQAQQNASRPADIPKWDVVSVKPCPPPAPGAGRGDGGGGGGTPPPTPFIFSGDRMILNCRPVRLLIRSAYQTYLEPGMPGTNPKNDVLMGMGTRKTPSVGPDWINSELYTIEAKASRATDRSLMQGPMLRTILEDRFKIKVHWEPREIELYALVVAKGGPKLKPFQEGSCVLPPAGAFSPPVEGHEHGPEPPPGQRFCSWGAGTRGATGTAGISGRGLTVDDLVKFLSGGALPFVVNKTGIAGTFDINLEWRLDDDLRQRSAIEGRVYPESNLPDLFKAIEEQLGLKLEKTKGPVEFHVVDHIERPSEN